MPRVKNANFIDLEISEIEKKEIENYIKINHSVKTRVDNIKKILKNRFCLSAEDIEKYVLKICESCNEKAIYSFENLFEEFAKNDISVDEIKKDVRERQAKAIIQDVLSLYQSESKKVSDEFIDSLREARRFNIDPFKFAIKTNLQNAQIEKFEQTIEALLGDYASYYFSNNSDKDNEKLFEEKEIKGLLEQCSTLAFRLNHDMVESVILELSCFVYNKKEKNFVVDVREMIRRAPSILLAGSKTISETAKKLQDYYERTGKDQNELILRVAHSPSVLACKIGDIDKVVNLLGNVYYNTIKQMPDYIKKSYGVDIKSKSKNMAESFVYDVTNLAQVDKIKFENIEKMQSTLIKFLGEENALTCLQNISILTKDYDVLNLVLATISSGENSTILREEFVKSPNKFFQDPEAINDIQLNRELSDKESFGISAPKKYFKATGELPQIKVTEDELKQLRLKVKKSDLNKIDNLLKQQQEEIAKRIAENLERKRKLKEEQAAAKKEPKLSKTQLRKMAKAAEAERKEQEREARLQEKENQPKKEKVELTEEEKKEKFWPKNADCQNLKNENVFEKIYGPLIEALKKCGQAVELPKVGDLNKIFAKVLNRFREVNVHGKQIMQIEKLFDRVYDFSERTLTAEQNEKLLLISSKTPNIGETFELIVDSFKLLTPQQKVIFKQKKLYDLFSYSLDIVDEILNKTESFKNDTYGRLKKITKDLTDDRSLKIQNASETEMANFYNQTNYVREYLSSTMEYIESKVKAYFGEKKFNEYFSEEKKDVVQSLKIALEEDFENQLDNMNLITRAYIQPILKLFNSWHQENNTVCNITERFLNYYELKPFYEKCKKLDMKIAQNEKMAEDMFY